MAIRLFEPCDSPSGEGCAIIEDPENFHLAETRWYTSALRIFDGSLVSIFTSSDQYYVSISLQMVVGGIHEETPFYNTDPVNSFEFFPKKDGGVPRPSAFLERSLPGNLFPR